MSHWLSDAVDAVIDRIPLSEVESYRYARHLRETRDQRINAAVMQLKRDFVAAALRDPDATVRCPSEYSNGRQSACDIVHEAGSGCDLKAWAIKREVLGVIVDAAKRDDERAKKLLEQIGQDFADMHAAELAEEE
jgi:hypothetical protein